MACCGLFNKQENKSLKSNRYKENTKEADSKQKNHFKIGHEAKATSIARVC